MSITERSLTREQYSEIMNRIWKHHRFARGGRSIKYVRPNWDLRDGKCFHIQFDNNDVKFDFRDNENSMYDNIISWLAEKEN